MTKRAFEIAAACAVLLLSGGVLRGDDGTTARAKALLKRAAGSNFEARIPLDRETYFKNTSWTNADGTKFTRHEIWKNGKLDHIEIRNAEGFFYVYPEIGTAIKALAPLPEEDFSDVAAYELRSCDRDGVDAWEIRQTIPRTEETFKIVENSRRNSPYYDAVSVREAFFNRWPAAYLYYVDKKSGLPLELKGFDRNGKQVCSVVYRDAKPLREFPPSAFAIPETYSVERPATDDDFEHIMRRTWISIQRARRKAEKK